MTPLFAAIEAGGTKFICVVGSGPDDLRAETRFPTTTPAHTLQQAVDFFRLQQAQLGQLSALGIASFGPVDLDPRSPAYGCITSTPKSGWRNTDMVGTIQRLLSLPVGFDTDVNAAALAEGRWGAARGLDTFIYVTIGTGIGGGGLVNGALMHGLIHPEMGHLPLTHDRSVDPFEGSCHFHGDCLEGLASGPSIEKRWGVAAKALSPGHPAWALEAHYLALGIVSWIYTLSPQKVILGGGVMAQGHLFPLIRREVQSLLAGYIQSKSILEGIDEYIVPPALGSRAGVLGALALAREAVHPSVLPFSRGSAKMKA